MSPRAPSQPRVPLPQVAQDVIEELCCEMGLQRPEAFDEYILFVVADRGEGLPAVPPGRVPDGDTAATLRLPGPAQGRTCGR